MIRVGETRNRNSTPLQTGVGHLRGDRRHLNFAAPVKKRHMRPISQCTSRRIDRRIAATNDEHALAVERLTVFFSFAQVVDTCRDARAVFAGNAQPARRLGAEAEKYHVMLVAQLRETNSGADIGVVLERDTEFEQAIDLGIQYIVG